MSTPGGTITRKDIIEDDALKVGDLYVAEMNKMIVANKLFAASILEYSQNLNNIRKVENNQQFLTQKQQEIILYNQSTNAQKLAKQSAIDLEKIEQESLRTQKLKLDAAAKEEAAKKRNTTLTIEERVQNEINNKQLKQEALERLGLVSAYTKLNAERTKAKIALKELIVSESASTAELRKAQKEFDNLDAKVKKADRAVGDFTKTVGNYQSAFASIGAIGKDLISAFSVTTGVAAVGLALKDAFATMKEFEQGVADLSAITGASGKDLEYLKNQAIDLGKSTKGGAIQVVEAYKLIASAKPELLENVKDLNSVTEAVLTLSKASGFELPDSATRLTDALNQFNAPASEAGAFVDALANGAKYGAAEIPQITDALLKFGSVARSTNVNIKESTALVELLAENGLKGADAGTALRNVMLKLSAPDALPKKAQEALNSLGISFEFLKDKSIPFQEKLEALKPILNDNAKLVEVFGLENTVAAQNIIGHTDRLKELTSKMGEFGTAQEQADIRMDTLNGDTEKLGSTYDSLTLSITNGSGVITNFFRFFVQGTTNALNGLIRLNTSWDDLFGKAQSEGAERGKKLFEQRFNDLIGDTMSDAQRQKIRDRIKEINSEIAKGNFSSNLKQEKADLSKSLGTGDDIEVSKSIALAASKQAKMYEKALAENSKKIKAFNPYAINLSGESGKDLQKQKETLLRALAEQNAIIQENNKKVQASRIKVSPTDNNVGGDIAAGASEADKKKREAANKKAASDELNLQKQLADSLYELRKQRLEQTIKLNEEIANDDEQSDEIRLQAVDNSQKKQLDLLLLSKKHLLDNDKLTANDRIRIEEDYSNKVVEVNQKTKEQIKKINEFDLAQYQADIDAKVKAQETAANTLEAIENDRFKNELSLLADNQKEIEEATKNHEKNLWQIKHDSAVAIAKIQFDNLTTELDAFKQQSDGSAASTKIIADLELKLSQYKKQLTELGLDNFKESKGKEVKTTKEKTQEVLEISSQMLGDLSNLSNAFSEAKIAKIDDEINKNNEYYDNQILLAGNDEKQKDLLEKERTKKNAILEKKKAEEKNKQAKIDKAVTIAQIAIATALAVIEAAPAIPMMVLAGAAGAIALATAIATPIPKYKYGRKDGPAETAMINDGGVQEVVTDASGSNARTTTMKNAIVSLDKHDIVHKSMEDYQLYIRNSLLNNIAIQSKKANDYQFNIINDIYSGEMIAKMEEVKNAIKNQKQNIVFNAPKIDVAHAIWANKNKNW